jgi:hypothetical protein
MKLDFIPRACPLCGGEDARVLVEATLELTASAFASRKLPEYMHSRMVECNLCGMLYANTVLRQEALGGRLQRCIFRQRSRVPVSRCNYRTLLEPHLATLAESDERARYWGRRWRIRREHTALCHHRL